MRHVTSAVVHPWNCDAQGHLNSRHYVGIFDDANQVLLAQIVGRSREAAADLGWADVRNEIDFLAEVTAGAVVDVFAAIRRIGTKSLTIALELRRADSEDVCARMLAIITRFDLAGRRGVALSQSLIESAQPWLEPAEGLQPVNPLATR
jgi:acyl-CoA thioester hydrolase